MRIDKYLWTIRQFKTRSQATQAVKNGQVLIDEKPVKAAAELKGGEHIRVKHNPIWRAIEVIAFPKSRVGAKLVADYAKDITPESELEKLEMIKLSPGFDRPKGLGRPTKKERRTLDKWKKP